jgi:hypothetical protein
MKLALLLFLALSARADVINLSLVSSTVTGAPGTTVTFTGTLANTSGADININGASLTLATFDPSASDLTDFILNATGLLANGTSRGFLHRDNPQRLRHRPLRRHPDRPRRHDRE